nr:MAG TPA: hypothetical protein [Caudoviricetes sp.]
MLMEGLNNEIIIYCYVLLFKECAVLCGLRFKIEF